MVASRVGIIIITRIIFNKDCVIRLISLRAFYELGWIGLTKKLNREKSVLWNAWFLVNEYQQKKSSICIGLKLLKYQSRIKFELAAIVAAAAAYEEKEEEEDDKEGGQSSVSETSRTYNFLSPIH